MAWTKFPLFNHQKDQIITAAQMNNAFRDGMHDMTVTSSGGGGGGMTISVGSSGKYPENGNDISYGHGGSATTGNGMVYEMFPGLLEAADFLPFDSDQITPEVIQAIQEIMAKAQQEEREKKIALIAATHKIAPEVFDEMALQVEAPRARRGIRLTGPIA